MKRRNFLASLAAVLAAPKAIEHPQQPGIEPPISADRELKAKVGRIRCVRVGPMPPAAWQRLNAGVEPGRATYVMIKDDE